MHLLISDYLLIVGGWTGSDVDTVELAIPNGDTIPSCPRSLNNFPVQMRGAVGTMVGE